MCSIRASTTRNTGQLPCSRRWSTPAISAARAGGDFTTMASNKSMRGLDVRRRTLFESGTLHISLFESRPVSDGCGDVERQSLNAIVLPLAGLFAKHEAPGRHVTGTPSNAIYLAPNAPYRISYPGAIGDRAITLRFDEALAPDRVMARAGESL